MMANLFSVFDPTSSILTLPPNWLPTFSGLLFIPSLYWIMPSRWSLFWSKVTEIPS